MSPNENRPIAFFLPLLLPLICLLPCQLMHLTSTRIGRSNPWTVVRTARERVGRERHGEWLAATATAISLLLQEHADTPGTTTTGRRPRTWRLRTGRGGPLPWGGRVAAGHWCQGQRRHRGKQPSCSEASHQLTRICRPLLLPLHALGWPHPCTPAREHSDHRQQEKTWWCHY